MAFKLSKVQVDVLNGTALVSANEPVPPKHFKNVTVQFPFTPPRAETKEQEQVIAEAKKVLQQALNEI